MTFAHTDSDIETWSGHTQEDKNKENITPMDTGAKGDGVTNDLQALKDASNQQGYATLKKGKQYYFGNGITSATDPDFNVSGSGELKWSNTSLGGYNLKLNPLYESMFLTPDSWHRVTRQGLSVSPEYPPYAPSGRGGDIYNIYNTVVSWRSNLDDLSKKISQVTAFGANIGVMPEDWTLTDCFGQDAAMFAKYSERNTFLGSETAVWAGAPNRQYLIDTNHDWYRNTPPNQWTAANSDMEQYQAGIGMEIYNYNNYPTSKGEVAYNTYVGRDCGLHFIRGQSNSGLGYQTMCQLLEGSQNTAIGSLASRNLVFGGNNTVVGYGAMRYTGKYAQCTVVGALAAQKHKDGNNAVVIGYHAARNSDSLPNSVVIGSYAASDIPVLNSKLFIGNANTQAIPLIGGDFSSRRVGVNVNPGDELANLHIKNSETGATTKTTGLMIEDASVAKLNLTTATNGYTEILLNVGDSTKASVSYGAAGNTLNFAVGSTHWRITSTGEFRPNSSGKNIGSASYRVGKIFLQNSPDVSSDQRLKHDIRSLEQREHDCALDIKANIKLYRMIGSEDQRWNCGVIAQEVIEIMQKHNLDWKNYNFVNHTTWDKETDILEDGSEVTSREAGDIYSVNYGSLSMFILSCC